MKYVAIVLLWVVYLPSLADARPNRHPSNQTQDGDDLGSTHEQLQHWRKIHTRCREQLQSRLRPIEERAAAKKRPPQYPFTTDDDVVTQMTRLEYSDYFMSECMQQGVSEDPIFAQYERE